jgi:hypothetical protein
LHTHDYHESSVDEGVEDVDFNDIRVESRSTGSMKMHPKNEINENERDELEGGET